MTNRRDNDRRPKDRAFRAASWLMATAVACTLVLFAVPRPVPLALPALMLDMMRVHVQLAQDAQISARPLAGDAEALYGMLLAVGRAELLAAEGVAPSPRAILAARERVQRSHGKQGVFDVCVYATQRFWLALTEGGLEAEEDRGLIGAQYTFLRRHGYVSQDGGILAPELTLRATYKVRCNMILARAPTDGLSPIEREAYEGFRGLEAQNLPLELRYAALLEYLKAGGGTRAERALAIVEAELGHNQALLARLRDSPEEAAQLRLRNMALAVMPRIED